MIVQQRVALGGGLTLEVGTESAGSSDPLLRIQSGPSPTTLAAIPARLIATLLQSAEAAGIDSVLALGDVRNCLENVAGQPGQRRPIRLQELIEAITPENVHEVVHT